MRKLLVVQILCISFYTGSTHAVSVVNGSMTDIGGDYNSFNGLVPSGWAGIPFTSPDIFDENTNFSNFAWNASSDGGTFVHTLGIQGQFAPVEGVFQDIAGLIVGESYIVSFEQSISFSTTGLQGNGGYYQVTFGDEIKQSANMIRPLLGVKANWQDQGLMFTATAETQRLTFLAILDPDDPGARVSLGLDGVSISAIPVPAAVWLFGSGLIGLVGLARRKNQV
jgi:hypothetical protein